jgi:hypothetical protein
MNMGIVGISVGGIYVKHYEKQCIDDKDEYLQSPHPAELGT